MPKKTPSLMPKVAPCPPNQVAMMKELAEQVKDYGLISYYNEQTAFAIGRLPSSTSMSIQRSMGPEAKLTEVLVSIVKEHLRQSLEGRDESPLKEYW